MSGLGAFALLFVLFASFIFVVWVVIPWLQQQSRKARRRNTVATPATHTSNTVSQQELRSILAEQPANTGVLTTGQWRDALEESPHLYIYGPSKAGKSTLAQACVAMLGNCEYVVIDPQPNKPGESKWSGIDFVTIDETGDEYASIKAALQRVEDEDNRRRRNMRHETYPPLVVIIDEVLALVGALGTITNEEGKKEPRMSQFIRTKGYSARHRNIKIILIGQGKNLTDLGLTSSTARNNYAMVRCSRNAATNQRAAYIVADEGEQAIDLRHVLKLASSAVASAQLWLTHGDLESQPVSSIEDEEWHMDADIDTDIASGIPGMDATNRSITEDTSINERDRAILAILRANPDASKNGIFAAVGGNRNQVFARIDELRPLAQQVL